MRQIFTQKVDVPTNNFCTDSYAQNFADSFHTKKLCSRLSSSEVRYYAENVRFAFCGLWGVGHAPATRLPQQDSRRRPLKTATHRGVALLGPEHH